jgi:hypothetical protein
VGPCWRNRQAFDSKEALLVPNSFPFCVKVLEVVAVRFSAVTGPIIAHVEQPSLFGAIRRVYDRNRSIGLLFFDPFRARPHHEH